VEHIFDTLYEDENILVKDEQTQRGNAQSLRVDGKPQKSVDKPQTDND
jgi:hypothetical protein